MSGDHNQYQKPEQEEGCAECSKKSSEGWALYCVKCIEGEEHMSGDHNQYQRPDYLDRRQWKYDPMTGEPLGAGREPEPVGWIYEDDEGRMMFSQMPHPDPLWEPVYREKKR